MTKSKILSQSEVLEVLGIPRQTFEQGIRPLMEREGDARNLSEGRRTMWAYDGNTLWRWKEYIAKRKVLIELNRPGWHSKRPYSVEDMFDLVDNGVLDGEIDHPLFAVAGGSTSRAEGNDDMQPMNFPSPPM